MRIADSRFPFKSVISVTIMLILMGLNAAVSAAFRGHAWSLFAVIPLSVAQAGLLVFALMELPKAGPVPRVYLGLALILLMVAALSFADYATRSGAWEAGTAGAAAEKR